MQSTLIKFSLQIDSLPADFHFAFSFHPLNTHCVGEGSGGGNVVGGLVGGGGDVSGVVGGVVASLG